MHPVVYYIIAAVFFVFGVWARRRWRKHCSECDRSFAEAYERSRAKYVKQQAYNQAQQILAERKAKAKARFKNNRPISNIRP